ncbi:MAG: monovalent cation/H(+) antiporter subunit G [Vallitaleaceae bacterium]|jgi:multicomponent Na+:H+ antiporter subunit G|nr:monovalent cation/H(+) antiporter subunit G [Vallitaleaceae bacterium]
MPLNEIIGLVIITMGTICVGIGIYGLYKFYDFYSRASIASIIDTAGFVLILIGVMVYKNLSLFSLKVGIILFFMIILNPLSNHIIVRGAHLSGFDSKGE